MGEKICKTEVSISRLNYKITIYKNCKNEFGKLLQRRKSCITNTTEALLRTHWLKKVIFSSWLFKGFLLFCACGKICTLSQTVLKHPLHQRTQGRDRCCKKHLALFLPKDTVSLQMCGHNHLTAHISAFFYFILPLFGQGQTWESVDIPLPRVKSWRKLQSTQEFRKTGHV